MKTLSGTFAFAALTVIAIVTLPSCCRKKVAKKVPPEEKFILKFGKKVGTEAEWEWVDVNKDAFDKALCALTPIQGKNGQSQRPFKVSFKRDAGATSILKYDPCPPVNIKTAKITTSRAARTEPAEESAGYDPHAVYRVQSNSFKEIKAVLDSFQDPSPTATPSTP